MTSELQRNFGRVFWELACPTCHNNRLGRADECPDCHGEGRNTATIELLQQLVEKVDDSLEAALRRRARAGGGR